MSESKGPSRGFVLVPAGTFLLGLVLGAVLVWVAVPGDRAGGGGQAAPSPGASPPAASPTVAPTPPRTTTIPASCVRSAEEAATAVTLVRDAVRAVGDLDAARLQTIVDQIEQLEGRIRSDVATCRKATGQLEPSTASPGGPAGRSSPSPS